MWIIDLGGNNRGAASDENVFAIQTPVAVVTLVRRAATSPKPAKVRYRRIAGGRVEKLDQLDGVHSPQRSPDAWELLAGDGQDLLVPPSSDLAWTAMPALTDLFPWQQPGCMLNRTWPIAPDPDLLAQRWRTLLAQPDKDAKAAAFVTGGSGRTIHTKVAGLPKLSELPRDAPHRPIVRYGYRSFDRQWTLQDPRLAKTESPSLWASLSEQQLFLSTMTTTPLGTGPALTVTTAVPDKHHFEPPRD